MMLIKFEEQVISECTESFVSEEVLQNYHTIQKFEMARAPLWISDWNVDLNQGYAIEMLDLRYQDTEVRKIVRAQRKFAKLRSCNSTPSADYENLSEASTSQKATQITPKADSPVFPSPN